MHPKKVLMIAAVVLGLGSWSLAQGGQAGNSHSGTWMGKTGRMTINAPVRVGTTVLPAGDYEVKHVNMPDRHFVEFTRVTEVPNPAWLSRRPPQATPLYKREKLAEVNCTREPLGAKAKKTAAVISASDNARIARLEIKGDPDAHVF